MPSTTDDDESNRSTPVKKNTRSFITGPPRNPPNRCWSSAGASSSNCGSPFSKKPANGAASSESSRKNPYARPMNVLVPLRVMTFNRPPEAVPYSAAKEFVITWNSWIQSCANDDAWLP